MKAEIYNALAALNRGAEMQLESLKIMETEGILSPETVKHRRQIIEETRAAIDQTVCLALHGSEAEESYGIEQMRLETEERLKSS